MRRALMWAALLSLLLPAVAAAQTQDQERALARQLFVEGVELAEAGQHEDAADRFRRARALFTAPSILYNLATSDLEIGELVEAAEALRELLRSEDAAEDLRRDARAHLDALEPRIPRLTVRVEGATDEVRVTLDDEVIEPAAYGLAMPVDPGRRQLRALRAETEVASQTEELAEGERREVTLRIAEAPAVPTPRQVALLAEPGRSDPSTDDPTGLIVGLTVGGVLLVAAIVVVAVLGGTGAFDAEQPHCGNTDPCTLVVP